MRDAKIKRCIRKYQSVRNGNKLIAMKYVFYHYPSTNELNYVCIINDDQAKSAQPYWYTGTQLRWMAVARRCRINPTPIPTGTQHPYQRVPSYISRYPSSIDLVERAVARRYRINQTPIPTGTHHPYQRVPNTLTNGYPATSTSIPHQLTSLNGSG